MAKHHKIIVNLLRGEEAINLAVQSGQALRIWVVEGANYLLQSEDGSGGVALLDVKAKRVGKDLQLLFDDAPTAQVVLIGYYEVALDSHTPLLGRMPDGTLREYPLSDVAGLSDGGEFEELALVHETAQSAGAVAALAPLAPLAVGPGALVAGVAGLAAAGAGGGGGGGGATAPALTQEEALRQLQTAAQNNSAKGLAASLYQTAGVSGVTDANVAAINDVLNNDGVTDATVSSKAQLQKMVDAYRKVLSAADNIDGNLSQALSVEDFQTLAVTGVTQASVTLLSGVVDGKATADVDTVAELQALADASKAVVAYPSVGSEAPTRVQINSLIAGLKGAVEVSADAVTAVQHQILANNTDSNGVIVSQDELLTVVKNAMVAYAASLGHIQKFAEYQLPDPGGFPTLLDYDNVGVSGVNESNRLALQDALASTAVGGAAVSSPAKLQVVIDAYNAILAEANGAAPDATPSQNPSAAQYAAIGADIGSASTDAQDLALLNDAVGAQTPAGVDSLAEILQLARITNAIQALAAGQAPSPGLTVADFTKIGLNTQGLSDNNPAQRTALLNAIAAKANDGSQTDSLSKLQAIVQSVLSGSVSPVVLDLNGDGALSYAALFMDVNADAQVERTAWVGPSDGVLVHDAHGDGRVTQPSQFAFARSTEETDLQGLAAQFDSNHDGVLNDQDAAFGEFKVWQDANGNGVSDAGELLSLQSLGLVSIDLHSDGMQRHPTTGVTEMGHALATSSDGSQVLVADAAFSYTAAAVHLTPTAGGSWHLEVGGDHQALDLSNLRAVYGDVRELDLGHNRHHTLQIKQEDVLAQPLKVDGDASTVLALYTGGQAVQAASVEQHGVVYQAYDLNRDGQLDLWVQQSVVVQTL